MLTKTRSLMTKFTMLAGLWVALFAALPPPEASAHGYDAGMLLIKHPWARATAQTATTGAAYLTIMNDGDSVDHLMAVKGDIAGKITLHQTTEDHGVMKMRKQDRIEVPAKGQANLQPGGYHIMLNGLKKPLVMGDKFHLTLVFEKAGEVRVKIRVDQAGGIAPAEHSGH